MTKRAVDDRYGKTADDPRKVPLRGWWEVIKRVVDQVTQDHVPVVAAGVAFFSFLSIFPAIAGFVILYGLVADPATVTSQLEPVRDLVPKEVFDLLSAQLQQVSGAAGGTLGFGLLLSLSLAIWSSAKGVVGAAQRHGHRLQRAASRGPDPAAPDGARLPSPASRSRSPPSGCWGWCRRRSR